MTSLFVHSARRPLVSCCQIEQSRHQNICLISPSSRQMSSHLKCWNTFGRVRVTDVVRVVFQQIYGYEDLHLLQSRLPMVSHAADHP